MKWVMGKSAQGIALAKHFGGRVCIICPSYLCKNWKREMEFWYPEHEISIVGKKVPETSAIISYDLTHRRELGKFNVLILDESHYVKNKNAKRTKAIMKMAKQMKHVFLLTGTPAPNKPVELWSQLYMLMPKVIGNYTSFTRRYCGAKQSPLGYVVCFWCHTPRRIGLVDEKHLSHTQIEERRVAASCLLKREPL